MTLVKPCPFPITPCTETACDEKTKKKSKDAINGTVSATLCTNCGTTTTPLWRRAPNGDTICNACGLYLKARNTFRPVTMKKTTAKKDECSSATNGGSCPGGGRCDGTGGSASCAGCPAYNQQQVNKQTFMCANCRTTTTPLWRRDEAGNTICNACGLYYKLHNVHRPVSMKRSVIKRRKRIAVNEILSDEETEESLSDAFYSHHACSTAEEAHRTDKRPRTATMKVVVKDMPKATAIATATATHSTANSCCVPAIEDYILPKRKMLVKPITPPPESPLVTIHQDRYMKSWEAQDSCSTLSSSPKTPTLQSRYLPLPLSEGTPQEPSFSFSSYYEDSHTMTLPPMVYDRQPVRLESFFTRRFSSSSASSYSLPPIAHSPYSSSHPSHPSDSPPPTSLRLPSLTTATPSSPSSSSSQTRAYSPSEPEFDHLIDRLNTIRKQAKQEHTQALSQLSQMLSTIVSQAESIVH
ncbi:hypothetical protein BDF14DRAFT_1819743 [Spinellus fusiger]|nr:hypothetical protein BDF14DRAFT_1819743 [Spinellus fusiger]